MGSFGKLPAGSPSRDLPGRAPGNRRPFPIWPVLLLTLPALAAIWSGWVGLGELCGFDVIHPLPGIWDRARINTAITLPVGMETYASYALWAWLSGHVQPAARTFAKWSAGTALVAGAAGQVGYHLMSAAGWTTAPWPVTILVSCVPVAVLGMGVALAHLIRAESERDGLSEMGSGTSPIAVSDVNGDIADQPKPITGPKIDVSGMADMAEAVEDAFRSIPEAPVSPAPRGRTPAEWVAEDDRLRAERPELTAEGRAELLGVSSRHIRNCRKQVAP